MNLTLDPSPWPAPPAERCLGTEDVHIWRAGETDAAEIEFCYSLLDSDEQARACQFRFPRERNGFVFCRGVLRQLLSLYTAQAPGDITFTYGPFGKPSIARDSSAAGRPSIYFNLSHTRGVALFAFSASFELGIDVEAIDPARDWQNMARRFFHPNEWALLESQPPLHRARTGYQLWTCKEAYLKALGQGIGGGLETFDVTAASAADCEVRVDLANDSKSFTSIRSLDVGDGFAAALAVLGRPGRLRRCNWRFDKALISAG